MQKWQGPWKTGKAIHSATLLLAMYSVGILKFQWLSCNPLSNCIILARHYERCRNCLIFSHIHVCSVYIGIMQNLDVQNSAGSVYCSVFLAVRSTV